MEKAKFSFWQQKAYLFLLFLSVCPGTDTARTADLPTLSQQKQGPTAVRIPKAYIRAKRQAVCGGEDDTPIRLEGVCFGNEVWETHCFHRPNTITKASFLRVKEMKMNVHRFYLKYGLLKMTRSLTNMWSTDGSGWTRDVEWSQETQGSVIFQHACPAGLVPVPWPRGWPSGTTRRIQISRLVALWRAIAERYKDETIVAGYDLS